MGGDPAAGRAGRRAKKLDFFLFQKFKVKITVIIGVKLAPSPSTRHNLATATPGGLPPASEASRPHAHARPGSGTPIKPPSPSSPANHRDSGIREPCEEPRQPRISGEAVIACQTSLYHELSIKSWCIVISTEKNGHLQPLITDSGSASPGPAAPPLPIRSSDHDNFCIYFAFSSCLS